MATYWVGTGIWNTSNTSNWSTTSGGAGGAPVPDITTDVIFDSGSGNCTLARATIYHGWGVFADQKAQSLTCSAFNGILTFDNGDNYYPCGLILAGNLTLSSSMTVSYSATNPDGYNAFFQFDSDATITSGGKMLGIVIGYRTLTMADSLRCNSLECYGVNTATHQLICGGNYLGQLFGGGIIIFDNATITGSRIETTRWMLVGTATLSAAGSTILCYGSFDSGGYGLTYGYVNLTLDYDVMISLDYDPLTLTSFNAAHLEIQVANGYSRNINARTRDVVNLSGNFTFGLLDCVGLNDGRRLLLKGPANITTTTNLLSNVDFMGITGNGFTGTRLGNCFGNLGITFDSPVTCIPVSSGSFESASHWNIRVPLPQDTINFLGSSYTLSLTNGMSIRIGSVIGNLYSSNLSRPAGGPITYIDIFPGTSPTNLDFTSGIIVPAEVSVYCDYGPPTLNIKSYGNLNITSATGAGSLSNDGNLGAYYGSVQFDYLPGGVVIGPSPSSTSFNYVFRGGWYPGANDISYPYGEVKVDSGTFSNDINATVYSLDVFNSTITGTNFNIGTFTGFGNIIFTGTLNIQNVSFNGSTINSGTLNYLGSGVVNATNMTLHNSHATPANTWYAITSTDGGSTDGGGNTGWIFGSLIGNDPLFFGSL